MNRKRLNCFAGVLLLALSISFTGSVAAQTQLTVFAAASLTDAFGEIATAFKEANPAVDIAYNFASSSTLATQLAEGAPADVFASANSRQMTVASDAKRIAGNPITFVKNRLILILPADNPAEIQNLRDLAKSGVKLVLAAPDVPVRDYTNTMLDRLAANTSYGESYRTAVLANLVSEEDNVRQVSAKVSLGEADAGIVYTSDVTPDVAASIFAIPIPDTLNTIATYPIAMTNNAADPELAQTFIDFVLSDIGQDILFKWNFISVRIPPVSDVVTLSSDGALTVDGQVYNPYPLTVENLQKDFTAQTVDVVYKSGEDTITAAFTGVPLWDVIGAAQPNLNADIRNDKLSTYIIVTGSDGYQAVIAWGEIDPEFANQPILLAYEQDGKPIEDKLGALRLVVPGDSRGGRYVSGVVNISLHDAAPVAN